MKRLLVLLETDGITISAASSTAVDFARSTGLPFDIVIAGAPAMTATAKSLTDRGAGRVLVAASNALAHPTADVIAALCLPLVDEGTSVIGPSTIADVLARIAGALDAPLITEVDGVEANGDELLFRSHAFEGRVLTKVRVDAPCAVVSIRLSASTTRPSAGAEAASTIEAIPIDEAALPQSTTWVSRTSTVHKRPPLEEARVIVAGGRSLGDAASFEQYLGKVADKLGGAVAASGGAVHSGIAPSTQLVGQTGMTVAPELYIAVGISGADQHVGGMQKSRVIVAINRDPHAGIFRVADYGLVADFRDALPELAEKL